MLSLTQGYFLIQRQTLQIGEIPIFSLHKISAMSKKGIEPRVIVKELRMRLNIWVFKNTNLFLDEIDDVILDVAKKQGTQTENISAEDERNENKYTRMIPSVFLFD